MFCVSEREGGPTPTTATTRTRTSERHTHTQISIHTDHFLLFQRTKEKAEEGKEREETVGSILPSPEALQSKSANEECWGGAICPDWLTLVYLSHGLPRKDKKEKKERKEKKRKEKEEEKEKEKQQEKQKNEPYVELTLTRRRQ